jgi:hypothetical protein
MKMKIYLLTLALAVASIVKAQNVYYDSKRIAKYFDSENKYGVDIVSEQKIKAEQALIKTLTENLVEQIALENKTLEDARRIRDNRAIAEQTEKISRLEKQKAENIEKNNKMINQLQIIQFAKKDTLFSILKDYNFLTKEQISGITAKKLDSLIKLNPFFKGFDFGGLIKANEPELTLTKIAASFSSLGGLNVTNITNAVAALMIDRAKQELTVAFFNRFKEFANKNPEFKILFPKTTNNLENLLSYKYPETLQALRTGFIDDLRQITFRLDDVLSLPRYQKLFDNLPEVKIAIRSLKLVHELETGASNAADVINELAHYAEWQNPKLENAGNILKTVALISESIRDTVTDKSKASVWVSAKELKKAFLGPNSETFATVYLGLLYQRAQGENIKYKTATGAELRLDTVLAKYKKDIPKFYDELREFIVLSEKVNVNYQDLKNKIDKKESISDENYYTYIETSLDVVEYGFSLAKLFGADVTKAEDYLSILKESNDLYKSIYSKEYNQAIVNVVDILVKIQKLADDSKVNVTDASSLISAKTDGNLPLVKSDWILYKENGSYYTKKKDGTNKSGSFTELDIFIDPTTFISSTKKLQRPLEKLTDLLEKIKPYALFVANVAEAKNEDDIKNALNAVILPVGSSSIKKHSVFNISVQSYLGARVSMFQSSSQVQNAWNSPWSVTAPIGFAFSWGGKGLVWKNPASFSIFASLLDIGAIVDYKLTTDSKNNAAIDYEIKLGQIISPGGYAVWGFPGNLPLSIGAGAQYGPGIFSASDGIKTVSPDWKFNMFLAVDIPFFNLYSKPRDKSK